VFLDWEECHADAIGPRLGEREAELLALAGEEFVRNLDEDAGAVAVFWITTAGAAVGKVQEDLNAFLDDFVALDAGDAGDKPDTAGVVLMRRVVETLRRRQAIGWV